MYGLGHINCNATGDALPDRWLRGAYAGVLADRVALRQPPVPIGCPSGGCALCGVGAVAVPAIEVARRAVCREVSTERLRGHVCPSCAQAIDAEGAVGQPAIGRAGRACGLSPGLGRFISAICQLTIFDLADAQVRSRWLV